MEYHERLKKLKCDFGFADSSSNQLVDLGYLNGLKSYNPEWVLNDFSRLLIGLIQFFRVKSLG